MPSNHIFIVLYKKTFSCFAIALVLLTASFSSSAQKKHLSPIQTSTTHLRHVVQPHETFASIGRLYGITGEEVADYNNLEYYNDDVLAKYLTIPLTSRNFTSQQKGSTNQVLVPVFKLNGTTERLIQFKRKNKKASSGYSVFFNNNGLISSLGSKPFIVGYLRTSKANSDLFKTAVPAVPATNSSLIKIEKKDSTNKIALVKIPTAISTPVRKDSSVGKKIASTPVVQAKPQVNEVRVREQPKPRINEVPVIEQPKQVGHRPVSRVVKVYSLVRIQLIITVLLVVIIFCVMAVKKKREIFRNKINGSIRAVLINEVLSEDSFNENLQKGSSPKDFLLKKLDKKSSRQFVIDEIIRGKKNLKGKAGENFLKLYLKLQLQIDSYRKLKSKNWDSKSRGIQELAIMEQNDMMPEIFTEINSKNEYVRMEAQSALVRLSGFGGLWFLNVLNYPISEWQQMKLINQLSTSPVSDIPDLHLLLASTNESLVIFTLKLISVFQQRPMHNAVIKCLNNKSEAVRYHAIKCLKEINNQYTASTLIRKFSGETRKNKIALIDVLGAIGETDSNEFLLQTLSIDDDTIKVSAARALHNMGDTGAQALEEYCINQGHPYTLILQHIKSANSYDLV